MEPSKEAIMHAAENMDWQQVVLNGGPPCFFLEKDEGRFCGRAQRWNGHTNKDEWPEHRFVSLADRYAIDIGPTSDTLLTTRHVKELEAENAALQQQNERLEAQWGIMARACGNWREFDSKSPEKSFSEWQTKEFQSAARAILECDEYRALLRELAEALKAQVPGHRATQDCWCDQYQELSLYGHSARCKQARAALARAEEGMK